MVTYGTRCENAPPHYAPAPCTNEGACRPSRYPSPWVLNPLGMGMEAPPSVMQHMVTLAYPSLWMSCIYSPSSLWVPNSRRHLNELANIASALSTLQLRARRYLHKEASGEGYTGLPLKVPQGQGAKGVTSMYTSAGGG